MSSIDEIAEEVAVQLVADLDPHPDPALQEREIAVARTAAVRMAIRLNKSIHVEEWLEKTLSFQARAVEIAQAHNQVIVLAGYAAFFTLWSAMAGAISVPAMLASGALMVVSAFVFIGWTVAGMFVLRATTEWQLGLYRGGPVDFAERQLVVEQRILAARDQLMKYWKPVVWAAAGSGGLAAALLAGAAGYASVSKALEAHAKSAAAAAAAPQKVAPAGGQKGPAVPSAPSTAKFPSGSVKDAEQPGLSAQGSRARDKANETSLHGKE